MNLHLSVYPPIVRDQVIVLQIALLYDGTLKGVSPLSWRRTVPYTDDGKALVCWHDVYMQWRRLEILTAMKMNSHLLVYRDSFTNRAVIRRARQKL
jgi:hypothetical protein